MTIKVKYNTGLLEPGEWNKAIKKAQSKIQNKATKELQKFTPVDTGLLTSQWKVKGDKLGIEASNKTPYAGFINEGTRFIKPFLITEKAEPIIVDMYENQILNEIEKL